MAVNKALKDGSQFMEQIKTYLQGGNLDYEDKGFSQRFVVNPSESTRKCGCGDSIALPSMQ